MTSKIEKNLDRPKRVPMHEARQILNVDDLPDGKVGRWVIDSKNRCQVFEKAGWEYVTERGLTVIPDVYRPRFLRSRSIS